MIEENNGEIIRRLYSEAISRRQTATVYKPRVNRFTQYTASAKPFSLKAFKNYFMAVSEALPDYDLTIDNLTVKEDRVMVRYTICGTQKNPFMGIAPTNERTTVTGIDIFRLDNGKVVEHWNAGSQVCALPQLYDQPLFPSQPRRPGVLTTI